MQETEETWVQSLGWEDPLEEGMAAHSSILAWRVPWTEEPGGLLVGYSPWGFKELDMTEVTEHPRKDLRLPQIHQGQTKQPGCRVSGN